MIRDAQLIVGMIESNVTDWKLTYSNKLKIMGTFG